MKFYLLVVLILLGFVSTHRISYDGYKAFRIRPTTISQLKTLSSLSKKPGFDFWNIPRVINKSIDVLVAPDLLESFQTYLKTNHIIYHVLIENYQEVIQIENVALKSKRLREDVSFKKYMTYEQIVNYLKTLAKKYPDIVTVQSIGNTENNRSIPLIKISTGGSNKPAILIDAGIHAREWIAPPVALYTIQQLVENATNIRLIQNVDWLIVPVLNPDGYTYTFNNDRLWRKNRSPGRRCYGADINRNFDFHWMEGGASAYECEETYAGSKGFSELEAQALRDFILANSENIKLYLTFHSYGEYMLYPWGYTSDLPDDEPELRTLGTAVADAIEKASTIGTSYTIGTSTNVLYEAAGGSDDWTKGVGGVQLSYTIELPGGGSEGFNPPTRKILPVVRETWEGIKLYQAYIEKKFAN
ncbi:unnamed protein product [Brassicogethes aeneus]|uniref:Zinc carboxypeptidase A 1 n=1 Tax=Brassicogethes aeneus TaxID=1431903 RepID=A0A9P0FA52_BRAAE|nr:unnamed protein product [Brassicogethes aeneus]